KPEGLGEGGFILGVNPPGHKGDIDGMCRVADNVLHAHRLGAAAIRSRANIPVGVTLALPDLQYEDGAQPGDSQVERNSRISDRFFELSRHDNFVGVQTYTRNRFGPEGPRGPHVEWGKCLPQERHDITHLRPDTQAQRALARRCRSGTQSRYGVRSQQNGWGRGWRSADRQ